MLCKTWGVGVVDARPTRKMKAIKKAHPRGVWASVDLRYREELLALIGVHGNEVVWAACDDQAKVHGDVNGTIIIVVNQQKWFSIFEQDDTT